MLVGVGVLFGWKRKCGCVFGIVGFVVLWFWV